MQAATSSLVLLVTTHSFAFKGNMTCTFFNQSHTPWGIAKGVCVAPAMVSLHLQIAQSVLVTKQVTSPMSIRRLCASTFASDCAAHWQGRLHRGFPQICRTWNYRSATHVQTQPEAVGISFSLSRPLVLMWVPNIHWLLLLLHLIYIYTSSLQHQTVNYCNRQLPTKCSCKPATNQPNGNSINRLLKNDLYEVTKS